MSFAPRGEETVWYNSKSIYDIIDLSWDSEDLLKIHRFHNNTSEIRKNIEEIWRFIRISLQVIEDLTKYSKQSKSKF